MALFTGALLAAVIIVVAGDCTKPRSAFTAKMTSSMVGDKNKNLPIVFDTVLTNVGNDYNSEDGKFTTRIAGTYVFSLTLMSEHSSDSHVYGCLLLNGEDQVCVWSNGRNGYEMSSNTITVNLECGDVVHNILKKNRIRSLHNDGQAGYCSFTGFLLYPEV
ncbi:C1q-related factor-like [Anneissia japonica]|uniref:C1q-related factor-like n=1 Tax=Anneissia japonica TaxID=1529436 RepID=UPI001425B36A|nr:C1q-related factor-like [Anneissia japonica]